MKTKLTARCKQYVCDIETPISLYIKLREHFDQCILLETNEKNARQNQRSYICFNPLTGITAKGLTVTKQFVDGHKTKETVTDSGLVLPILIEFFESYTINKLPGVESLPGFFGYTAYDAVRYFEDIEVTSASDVDIPDIMYHLYKYVIVIDHLKNELQLITITAVDDEQTDESLIESVFKNRNVSSYPFSIQSAERGDCNDDEYLQAVEKGKAHCYRGDVFQVVLSRGFRTDFHGDDFNVYRALRSVNPSPYLFYFDYNGFHLFGSSPEAQVKVSDRTASIHPIAGTYKRTGNEEQDILLAEQLQEDSKENAEHVMLVDLARNDLHKHYREITVPQYREIEQFSHVIHLVSKVEGRNEVASVHPLRLLADTFPAGTLSGAPKYKAMQIIAETEAAPRGFYGGCVGYIGFDGAMNMAIMIRSFLSINNTLHYRAGAGITAASVPQNELQEINNKIAALRKSLDIANTIS